MPLMTRISALFLRGRPVRLPLLTVSALSFTLAACGSVPPAPPLVQNCPLPPMPPALLLSPAPTSDFQTKLQIFSAPKPDAPTTQPITPQPHTITQ